ncbi:MAG: hypothetical protein RIR18_944 [Pseudomonadota bacterium]|jgi:prepilin-type N-terminal cleavage/methylation domain-containing protein
MPRQKNYQQGFTLIELSMVLVIIGLLLAGVLKGTELINQARMRNIGSSLEGLSVAFQTYQERYRSLPGDDAVAQSRWPSSASNGNGDRIVCGAYHGGTGGSACSGASESSLIWQHLRSAGLLAGSGSGNPEHPGNGIFGVQYGGYGMTRHILCASHLPGSIAGSIDRQFDDGLANQGDIRASTQASSGDVAASVPTSTSYIEEGSTLYVLCKVL